MWTRGIYVPFGNTLLALYQNDEELVLSQKGEAKRACLALAAGGGP